MKPVGQLDEDDANVLGHRQRHFLKILCLPELNRVEFDVGQLADAIHQIRDFHSKLGTDIQYVDALDLDHIVEECRHQALCVHMHSRKDAGDGQRMRHIGFATASCLAIVGLLGVIVGSSDELSLFQRQVVGDQLLKGGERTICKLSPCRCRLRAGRCPPGH